MSAQVVLGSVRLGKVRWNQRNFPSASHQAVSHSNRVKKVACRKKPGGREFGETYLYTESSQKAHK